MNVVLDLKGDVQQFNTISWEFLTILGRGEFIQPYSDILVWFAFTPGMVKFRVGASILLFYNNCTI